MPVNTLFDALCRVAGEQNRARAERDAGYPNIRKRVTSLIDNSRLSVRGKAELQEKLLPPIQSRSSR